MPEEQLKAFLEKVNSANTPEAASEITNAEEFLISAVDIQSTQSESVELLGEELEGASGGGGILRVSIICEYLGDY